MSQASATVKPAWVPAAPPAVEHVGQVDARMLGLMRCVLAFSALAIMWIHPSEPRRLVELTYASLAFYCAYSVVLVVVSYRSGWPTPRRAAHWADVLFFTFLVALTETTSNIFFHFYFFAILLASHARGYREGLLVTIASFILFAAVGLIGAPFELDFELNRTLIPAIYLLALGYIIAYWGGYEMLLKSRLRLLQEVNNLWNPRFGVDHTIGANLDRLLDFYGGTSCTLVVRRPTAPPSHVLYSATRRNPGHSAIPNEITAGAAAALLRLPGTFSAAYRAPAESRPLGHGGYLAYDFDMRAQTSAFREECAAIANLLDTRTFITVPYVQREGGTGRIYLTFDEGRFNQSDIDFLVQASHAMATVVENMHLMEELVSTATEDERRKISRDLHDTTIQPYIGLKLALEALQREAGADHRLARRISELADMTAMTVRDLRGYAASLREATSMPGESLVAAVQRQAQRLEQFYGVRVEVKAEISPRLDGRMAAESFQIISEGLSNVLRHTTAKAARVSILCRDADLELQIANEADPDGSAAEFTPRSIHERTQALGGRMRVDRGTDGYTVVHVTIPL